MKRFEFLKHTADVKIRIYGKSIEKIFENSAYSLRRVILRNKKCKGREKNKEELKKEKIKVSGKDYLSLLYNFLEELIYLVDTKDFIIKKIESIQLKKFNIKSSIIGEKFSKYKLTNNVKAITYNEMSLNKKKDNSFSAEFVLDL